MFSVGDYDDFFSAVKESFRYTGVGFAGHCICAVQWETHMILVLWNDFSSPWIRKVWELLFEFIVLHSNIKYRYYCLFQIWMTVYSIQVDKLTEVFCVFLCFALSFALLIHPCVALLPVWFLSFLKRCLHSSLSPAHLSLPRYLWGFLNVKFFMGWGCPSHAQPSTWRTRISVCVWVIAFDLSVMEDPASSYATDIALVILW